MNKRYVVNYEGWLIIEAPTMDEAMDEANKLLTKWEVTNDGDLGEWYLGEVEENN